MNRVLDVTDHTTWTIKIDLHHPIPVIFTYPDMNERLKHSVCIGKVRSLKLYIVLFYYVRT